MSEEFLTTEEIVILTGFKYASRQIEQLRTYGIPFFKNGRGKPIVLRSAISGSKPAKEKPPNPTWQPSIKI